MGPLESRNDFAMVFFARIFTLDESFTLKFHFEKSRPGRAAAERQLGACASQIKTPPTKGSPNRLVLSI